MPRPNGITCLRHFRRAALATTLFLLGCSTAPDARRWTDPAELARSGGDLNGAIALYEEALVRVPADPAVSARLAALLLEQADAFAAAGQVALADDRYARAAAIGGSAVLTPSVLVRRADLRRDAGRDWAAEAELLEAAWALASAPDEAHAPELAAELAWRLALGWDEARESARALPYFEALLAADAGVAAPTVLRAAQLQEELGMDEAAAQSYRRYLQLQPGAMPGLVGLSVVLERRGELDAAEALLVSAADDAQRPGAALRLLRSFYQRNGDRDGVARVDARLTALAPEAPERHMRPLKERR